MAAITSSLALASNITAFDCVELWTLDANGTYYCPYVHASAFLQEKFPKLIVGHHPRERLEHVLSPKVIVKIFSSSV